MAHVTYPKSRRQGVEAYRGGGARQILPNLVAGVLPSAGPRFALKSVRGA